VVPGSPTVGLLVGCVGHDHSSVAYSSGALSPASRLSILTTSLLLLEAPALFMLLSFREWEQDVRYFFSRVSKTLVFRKIHMVFLRLS
jgi:hypothetical protein